jgi:hypothetical protein
MTVSERATLSTVIARLDRAIQYSEALVIELKSRGVLDTPHARSMTVANGGEHRILPSLRGAEATKQSMLSWRPDGLLRGACHRARIRATRWLAIVHVH